LNAGGSVLISTAASANFVSNFVLNAFMGVDISRAPDVLHEVLMSVSNDFIGVDTSNESADGLHEVLMSVSNDFIGVDISTEVVGCPK
jgi:hypothetical protein